MKTHKLKLTTCEVTVKVEFVSSNYFAITFPKHFLPFDYRWNTGDEITVYADVYPDWTITVGKHSNEDTEVFDYLMDNQNLVEGIKKLIFNDHGGISNAKLDT